MLTNNMSKLFEIIDSIRKEKDDEIEISIEEIEVLMRAVKEDFEEPLFYEVG